MGRTRHRFISPVGDDQEKYYEQKYLLNVALTDEDDIVCNPPESWVELCASEGMCDSHTDALSSLHCAASRGFSVESLRALAQLYVEHSFITEDEADTFLSAIPVLGEHDTEPQVNVMDHLLSDPQSDMGSLVPNRPSFCLEEYVLSFTESQRRAYDWLSDALGGSQQVQAAIIGPAGTGESYLLNGLIQMMRSRGLVVAKLAPSGVAAHLIGGTTIHNFFGLDIQYNSKLENGTVQVTHLRKTDVLVIDEFSMLDAFLFRTAEGLCHKFARVRCSGRPWGGRHVLLLGDPAQLPAVSCRDIFGTQLWTNFTVLLLREVKRATDPVLSSLLSKVRVGICDSQVDSVLRTRVRKENWDTIDLTTTVVICSRRDECAEINDHCIQRLEGSLCKYDAIDTDHNGKPLRSADHDRIQRCRERLDDKLLLKVGARVLLRRNMDIKDGWVNGTGNSDCDARELHSGQEDEQDHPVPRLRQKFEIPGCSYSIMRSQFPLQLAYAVTVHRVQGMTVQKAIVKLDDRFFASGQAYVALSRVKRLEDLILWQYSRMSIHTLDFYKKLLEWSDCVDAIRPSPPTSTVPFPERADDTSNAPLPMDLSDEQADEIPEHMCAPDSNTASTKHKRTQHKCKLRNPPSQKGKSRKRKQPKQPKHLAPLPHKKPKPNPGHENSPALEQLDQAVANALGTESPSRILQRLALLSLDRVVAALEGLGPTLMSIVPVLNSLPFVYLSTHPHLPRDSSAEAHCHPLLLETYRPIVTAGDNNCGFNAVSITLTGTQRYSPLIRLLCAYSVAQHEREIIDAMVEPYTIASLPLIYNLYCSALRKAVTLGAWANDCHLYALSLLLNRPVFQYSSFYDNYDSANPSALQLQNTRDVHHLAERFHRHERGTGNKLLYCSDPITAIVSSGDLTQLPHPPICIFNLIEVHWVVMLLVSHSVFSHIPIPYARLYQS